MSKKLKKSLSWLLALCMILSLLPMSVFAATYENNYISFDWSSSPATTTTMTVYVQDEAGNPLGTPIVVSDFANGVVAGVTIKSLNSDYEILTVEQKDGSASITVPQNGRTQYDCNLYTLGGGSIIVTLCEASTPPQIEGDNFTAGLVEYRLAETQALKMLYLNRETVTAQTEIKSVKMQFIQTYGAQQDQGFTEIATGADILAYWNATISAATDEGKPNNIRYLEIVYDNGAGEKTARIPSGALLYVNDVVGAGGPADLNRCEIKAAEDNTHIVAFYIEEGGELDMWSLYDVRFVADGGQVGVDNMPKNPEYVSYEHTNWATTPKGGDQFWGNETITADTMVYGMKSSSALAGTEIHVMNGDNSLVNRVVELYNANHPDAQINAGQLDLDSMKIKVTGDSASTNPDYQYNRWNHDLDILATPYEYYFVTNSELPGTIDDLTNHHVPHDEITAMTVYVNTTDGTPVEVTIPRSYRAGDFSGTLTGQDNIFEIIINAAPTKPSDSDLTGNPEDPDDPGILGNITVQCTNTEASHNDKSKEYDALTGSYQVGEVTALADGGYTCDVTVESDLYITAFNKDTGNVTHTPANDSETITLTWNDATGKWVAPEDALPVTFEVECKTPEVTYSVTFTYKADANGALKGVGSSEITQEVTETVTLTNGVASPTDVPDPQPNTGYKFAGWKQNGKDDLYTSDELKGMSFSEGTTFTAVFEKIETPAPDTITFVYEAGANGALKGEGSSVPTEKVTETVTLANGVASPTNVPDPQPNTGYKFVGWKQNGKDDLYTSDELQKMSFSKGTTFTAVFEKKEVPAPDTITFTYKAGVNGDLKNANRFGIVTENVAIRENNTASPTKVPTPLPDTGYKFIGWKQNGKVNLYTSAELKKMSFYKDTTFTAVFEKIDDDQPIVEKRYTIEATAHKGGEISPDGIYKVYKYSDKTYTITADKGYKIYDVVVDGVSVGAVHTYTFERVTEDHTIEVYFAKLPTDPDDSGTSNWLETKDHVAYMTGYPDGTFGPNRNMTRAEVAQMFYALLLNKNVTTTVAFSDVSADAWYAKAVNTLASLGMVSGYPDGTFHPDAPITRAEFATIALAFAYEPLTASCNYNDVPTSAWFYTYVAQATTYGWIGGSNGYFRPNDNITRAEVSVIVNNMLGRAADEDYVDAHAGDLVTFPDVRSSFWAYYSIMETVNDHEYVKLNGLEDWK